MSATNPKYEILPEHIRDAMKRYIEEGILPGSFLCAVLESNLVEAFQRADSTNTARMRDIADFLYNETPTLAWGSPKKVDAWLKLHSDKRAKEAAK